MEVAMITALLLTAGALWLIGHNKKVSGIGAVKKQQRRIWSEVEQAQRHGIDLTDKDGWQGNEETLEWMAHGKVKEDGSTPQVQRYFNQLRRAYNSIAGTNLPYDESVVRNENDDVILIYRNYHLDKLPQKSAEHVYDQAMETMNTNTADAAYWATIALIANGTKFVWSSSRDKVHRGVEQLVFGHAAPEERKKRISYIATPQKGGEYPEKLAHKLWEQTGMTADDQEITNGVLEALRDTSSRGIAQEWCKREYLKAFQVEEPLLYQDVPF